MRNQLLKSEVHGNLRNYRRSYGTMDRSNATGQPMFHLFAAFAEFERNLILERSAAGRVAARARGRLGGQPE